MYWIILSANSQYPYCKLQPRQTNKQRNKRSCEAPSSHADPTYFNDMRVKTKDIIYEREREREKKKKKKKKKKKNPHKNEVREWLIV